MPSTAGKIRHLVERAQALVIRLRDRLERVPRFTPGFESMAAEQRNGAPLLAAGLAYRLFFWLVAFGLLVAAALSFWVRSGRTGAENTAEAFGLAGVAARSATSAVQEGSHARWYFLVSGLLLIVYFGIAAVRALRVASFLAWRLEPTRMRGALSASLTFSGFLLGSFVAELGTAWLRHHGPGIGLVATIADAAVFSGIALAAFALLPHAELPSWRGLLPGAVLVGCGLTAMHVVVAYYLVAKLERSPDLYGALGAATVVLLWLYLLARVVVSGMFLNATIARRHQVGVA